MQKLRLLLLVNLTSITGFAQHKKSLELILLSRYDQHADYTTRYFDRVFTSDIKLYGYSHSAGVSCLQPVQKHFHLKLGVNYYRLAIDKIDQRTRLFGKTTNRSIDYDYPQGRPLLATNKYHYNNIGITAGLQFDHRLAKQLTGLAGMNIQYLYTFSQLYHIAFRDIRYKEDNDRYLGFGIDVYFGLSRRMKSSKYYLSPKLIISLYQQLNGDPALGEEQSVKMKKWLSGGGFSVSIGRYL